MSIEIKENIILAPYTVYKIGGPARYFTEVKSYEELREALNFAAEKNLPIFILGAGSNILVSDKGFAGLVIKINLRELHCQEGRKLVMGSGVSMAQVAGKAAQLGLTGFEWAIGIPGTIGGSVRGNAGCFGGEISQVLESVRVLEIKNLSSGKIAGQNSSQDPRKPVESKIKSTNQNSKFFQLQNAECDFSYRDSVFKRHPEWIIVSVTLALKRGDPRVIQENIKRISAERAEKQDIGLKSCGCIFKNIPWTREDINKEKLLLRFPELAPFQNQPHLPASFLIDQAGLKGRRVGKVCVSGKHANYFINEGGATAEEVIMLIAIAKEAVRRKYGILLEEEIEYVGF